MGTAFSGMMSRLFAATLALLATAQLAGAFVATPGGLSLRAPGRMQMATARTSPRMAEQTEQEPESVAVESETRVKGLEARSTSWLSRNLSEERRNQRTFYDIEKRGEQLTEIGKWQRTNGPIYIQATGGLMLVAGFVNYFGAANAHGLSQPLWCTSILVALLGFALQREGGD